MNMVQRKKKTLEQASASNATWCKGTTQKKADKVLSMITLGIGTKKKEEGKMENEKSD